MFDVWLSALSFHLLTLSLPSLSTSTPFDYAQGPPLRDHRSVYHYHPKAKHTYN